MKFPCCKCFSWLLPNFPINIVVSSNCSLAIAPTGSAFASVGEDSSLRVWKDSNVSQVLSLPAQSVWSVSYLPNSDIVTGSR